MIPNSSIIVGLARGAP